MMKHKLVVYLCGVLALMVSFFVSAADEADIDVGELHLAPDDQASLQRGARNFINTCAGCHSLEFMRFSRMAEDIGITDADGQILTNLLTQNLMFTTDTVTDTILTAIPKSDAAQWFGTAPPDLTLITRARSPQWVYQYLKSFYIDEDRPWGVNNAVFPDVGMPHVLAEFQGDQEPIYRVTRTIVDGEPEEVREIVGFNQTKAGLLTPEEYDEFVTDLVNFLVYAAEPGKQERHRVGIWVILFLIIILAFSYLLKREYWKDIH